MSELSISPVALFGFAVVVMTYLTVRVGLAVSVFTASRCSFGDPRVEAARRSALLYMLALLCFTCFFAIAFS